MCLCLEAAGAEKMRLEVEGCLAKELVKLKPLEFERGSDVVPCGSQKYLGEAWGGNTGGR